MTTKWVKLSFKNNLLVIQTIKLQSSNTYKIINSFIRKKLYFIYFTFPKATIELRFQTEWITIP